MRFITPSIMDRSASMLMKLYQFQREGKTWPMLMKLPTDLYAPEEGWKTSLRSFRYPLMFSPVSLMPAGMAASREYSLWQILSGWGRYIPILPLESILTGTERVSEPRKTFASSVLPPDSERMR